MTVVRFDGVTADIRGAERAQGFIRMVQATATTGDELRAAVLRCPPEELAAFLRSIQKAIPRRP